jgi:hypothetical protein
VVLVVLASAVLTWQNRRAKADAPPPKTFTDAEKSQWRMPPLALLEPVSWSPGTKLGMLALRAYLVLGAILLIVKAVQLAK